MPAVEEELHLNGVGRTQIYQQPSTGEKHVLFYPTSPAPSINSEERRSWSQASSAANHVSFSWRSAFVIRFAVVFKHLQRLDEVHTNTLQFLS